MPPCAATVWLRVGKHFRQARRRQALLGETERRAQARAAGADDDHVVAVVDEFVVFLAVMRRIRTQF